MKARVALAAALLLSAGPALAAGGPGTSVAPLLKLGPGARPAALGEAYVAVAEEADASAWNPAGLAFLPRPTATLMFLRLHEQINYNYLAYGAPWNERFGFGGHLVYAKTDDMPRTFEDPGGNFDPTRTGDSFSNSNLKLALSGAYKALPWLSAGGGLSLLRDTVDDQSTNGAFLDLGVLARPAGRFAYGLALQNLGSAKGGAAPTLIRAGASAYWDRKGLLSAELDRAVDSGESAFAFGGECRVMPMLAVRLGYRFGPKDDAGGRRLSVGMGFRFERIGFDYAMVPFGRLGVSQRASISYAFGSLPGAPVQAGTPRAPREEIAKEPDAGDALEAADRALARRRYAQARGSLEEAVKTLPPNDERHIRALERLGYAQAQLGRTAQAKDAYMRSLRKAKELGVTPGVVADAYVGLGICLIKEGNPKYARKIFERALEMSPSAATRKLVEAEMSKLDASRP